MRQCQNGSNWIHSLSRFTSQTYLDLCTAESVLCQTLDKHTFLKDTLLKHTLLNPILIFALKPVLRQT